MPSSLSGLSSQCGTGYSVTPITRRSGSRGTLRAATESQSFVCRSSRIRHPSQARTAFGMTKLRSYEPFAHPPGCLVHPFRDCPGSSGTGFMVHPCTRCSQGSPFASTFGGYNSTIPWSRFSGLVPISYILYPISCAHGAFRLRRPLSLHRMNGPGFPLSPLLHRDRA
jgi:hypothetical protein